MTIRRTARAGAVLLLLAAVASAEGLTEAQRRGKRIYMEGKGQGKIAAVLSGSGISAPGKGFPCVNCHLAGGGGQREGGVRSADITYFNLTKEYGGVRPTGRVHPAYTDEAIMAAVVKGVDPAGNALDPAHPRYRMSRGDLEDLVAYIKVMDREPVPGVTDNEVRVGVLLPAKGNLAEAGEEVRALLSGVFAEANGRGGFFQRSLVLVPVPFDPGIPGDALAAARKVVEEDDVFCFLGNVGVPAEDNASRFLTGARVPVVAPLVTVPEAGWTDRYTFHVFGSVGDQARVMVDFVAGRMKPGDARIALVHSSDPVSRGGAAGAREQAARRETTVAGEREFGPGKPPSREEVARLKEVGPGAVLYFGGPGEALAFLSEADALDWHPLFLAPAPMVADALGKAPAGFRDRLFLASPLEAGNPASPGMEAFFRVESKYGVGRRHRTFQFIAYAGAILLEEGLTRTGRGVTREKFVDAIGNVWMLETGVTPPLTYSPNRRAGAVGASILRVEPGSGKMTQEAKWREPR
ncbi:MAG TPA: ABC transporter substrate-binding protein [Candidatus Deferrimicrobiaceae bacterium]